MLLPRFPENERFDTRADGISIVKHKASEAGGCNFCSRHGNRGTVYKLTSRSDMLTLAPRLCADCLRTLKGTPL